ncbi:MAG: alpha-L-fucosidase [Anaerolineaceae bacterium]|nr:alpha-L-fucosidase [Anaerolineaceae bacterium]
MVKQASEQGLKWYQDVRFGMFIHWGPSAVPARHDWIMAAESISVPDYEQYTRQFNPTKFNADEWVSVAADAGQKYIVFTSRHHDGFSMYDTALSDYKITNTAFGRDPARELADACARRGDIKLGFYNSLLDWHHPAYRFREESGLAWSDYLEFLHGQVRELCTNFGEIACMWFDGHWPNHQFDEEHQYFMAGGSFEYEKLYNMIHTLQPDATVLNNHHAQPQPGEDVQGFEQDLPGMNTTGWQNLEISSLALEVCMTINDHWFYIRGSDNHKSLRSLVHYLARAASAGANYLLNVGPNEEGVINPIHVARLQGIGAWLQANGESIYGTRAGVIEPTASAVSTRNGDTHYVHLLDYISDSVTLAGVPDSVNAAHLLVSGDAVPMERTDKGVVITVPAAQRDPLNTVVVLS